MLEFEKIRHKKVWWIVAALVLVQGIWSLWSAGRMDAQELKQGWMFFLYQFPLLNSIMMPILAAVVASRLSDNEHKGHTFKLLYTVMPAGRLFDAKFLCGALHMLAAGLLQLILMVSMGYLRGFAENPPLERLLTYLLFTTAVNLALLTLQQSLSLLIVNQLVPLTVGLMGGLGGLFIMFFPPIWERFLLWGYYGVLMLVGMNWDSTTRISSFYYAPADWGSFLTLLLMSGILYAVGRTLFVRKEM